MGDVHHCTRAPVSEMTYTVSSGTLNSTIPIPKSYIVYLEIYVVPIGHGFSFFGYGKVMESQC